MHAYIIVAQTKNARKTYIEDVLQKLGISPFDRIYAESEGSLGIKDVREFIKKLAIGSSTEFGKAGIILDGDSMTPESQHALLKTLEEPPPKTTLYIGTNNISSLLPTIVSRAVRIDVTDSDNITTESPDSVIAFINELSMQKKGERIQSISRIGKTKEEIITWVDTAIRVLHETDPQRYRHLLRYLLRAKKYQPNNVHPLLFVEQAFLMIS